MDSIGPGTVPGRPGHAQEPLRQGRRTVTRETKLALIIGFALVMVVGVLISDHLAASNRTPIADLTTGPAGAAASTETARATGSRPATERSSQRDATTRPTRLVPTQPLVQLNQGSTRSSQPGSQTGRSRSTFAEAIERARDSVDSIGDLFNPATRTSPAAGSPAATGQSRAPPTVWHTVVENESLWEIAKAYYGRGSRWSEIAAANPGRVGADGAVREGVKIKIPGGQTAPVVASTPTPARSTTAGGGDSYTVKAGDTLGQIAQRLLGTMKRADEIMVLNRTVISSADEIRVGMVLEMPAR